MNKLPIQNFSWGCNLTMWCAINFSEWGYLQMHLMPLYHLLKFMIYIHPHEKLFESHAQIHFLKNIIVCVIRTIQHVLVWEWCFQTNMELYFTFANFTYVKFICKFYASLIFIPMRKRQMTPGGFYTKEIRKEGPSLIFLPYEAA